MRIFTRISQPRFHDFVYGNKIFKKKCIKWNLIYNTKEYLPNLIFSKSILYERSTLESIISDISFSYKLLVLSKQFITFIFFSYQNNQLEIKFYEKYKLAFQYTLIFSKISSFEFTNFVILVKSSRQLYVNNTISTLLSLNELIIWTISFKRNSSSEWSDLRCESITSSSINLSK